MSILDAAGMPTDDVVLQGLIRAMAAKKKPCDLLREGFDDNSYVRQIIQRYPKTLAFLAQPQNKAWFAKDTERLLGYLVTLSQVR